MPQQKLLYPTSVLDPLRHYVPTPMLEQLALLVELLRHCQLMRGWHRSVLES